LPIRLPLQMLHTLRMGIGLDCLLNVNSLPEGYGDVIGTIQGDAAGM
jgi:hypothetical protein